MQGQNPLRRLTDPPFPPRETERLRQCSSKAVFSQSSKLLIIRPWGFLLFLRSVPPNITFRTRCGYTPQQSHFASENPGISSLMASSSQHLCYRPSAQLGPLISRRPWYRDFTPCVFKGMRLTGFVFYPPQICQSISESSICWVAAGDHAPFAGGVLQCPVPILAVAEHWRAASGASPDTFPAEGETVTAYY